MHLVSTEHNTHTHSICAASVARVEWETTTKNVDLNLHFDSVTVVENIKIDLFILSPADRHRRISIAIHLWLSGRLTVFVQVADTMNL